MCWSQRDASAFLGLITKQLDDWGLPYRVECSAAFRWNTIGLSLFLRARILINKPLRTWRVRGAVLALLRVADGLIEAGVDVQPALVRRLDWHFPVQQFTEWKVLAKMVAETLVRMAISS